MHEMMAALIVARRPKLPHAHVAGIEHGDQAPYDPALSGGVPALEEHAKRWPQLGSRDEPAELEPKSEQPALGIKDALLALTGAHLELQVCIPQRGHVDILSGDAEEQ